MSSNLEKSDSKIRVTRSMIRMSSSESLNVDSDRPETPTRRLKTIKKLDIIDETAVTPTKRSTRADSIQKTITSELPVVNSPIRRMTRRSSENAASPARLTRASSKQKISESDDDDIIFVSEYNAAPRTKLKRLSVNVVKLEAMNEQPELELAQKADGKQIENEETTLQPEKEIKETNGDDEISTSDLEQLELRNRSITKSPGSSLNNSLTNTQNTNFKGDISEDSASNLEIVELLQNLQSPKKMPDSQLEAQDDFAIKSRRLSTRKSTTAINERDSSEMIPKIDKNNTPLLKLSSNIENSKDKGESEGERIAERSIKVSEDKTDQLDQKTTDQVDSKDLPTPKKASLKENLRNQQPENDDSSKKSCAANNISLNSRDSGFSAKDDFAVTKSNQISNEISKNTEEIVTEMMEDFNPVTVGDEGKTSGRDVSKNLDEIAENVEVADRDNKIQKIINKTPKKENKLAENIIKTPKNNKTPENGCKTPKIANKSPKTVNSLQLTKCPSFNNKTQMYATDMLIDIDSDCENDSSKQDQTSKEIIDMDVSTYDKGRETTKVTSNTWSESIRGSAKKIDAFQHATEPEVMHDTSSKRKVISSDESEDEKSERNSLIDDEAEVANSNEESMTKSERDYLEQNEIVDDGESIGSQDSAEFSGEEEENEDDSFIDNDEISDTYSMDSHDKLIEDEENASKNKKTKSRIVKQTSSSSSEDEGVKMTLAEKSPAKSDSSKSPGKTLKSPVKAQISKTPVNSPLLTKVNKKSVPESSQEVSTTMSSPSLNKCKSDSLLSSSQKSSDITPDKKLRKSVGNIEETVKEKLPEKKSRKSLPIVSFSTQRDADDEEESPVKISKKDRKSLSNIAEKSSKQEAKKSLPLVFESKKDKSLKSSSQKHLDGQNSAKNDSEDEQIIPLTQNISKTTNNKNSSKKRKRETHESDESEEPQKSAKRSRKLSANESEALHMDDQSHLVEKNEKMDISDEEKPKKSKNKDVDIHAILDRCNEYLEKTKEEKKAKMALKREQKAKKLEKKQMKKETEQEQENLENDENSLKKKKKNKKKKQKLLEEIEDNKKENLSEKLDLIQQKLEIKRQRKKEKKLAKMMELKKQEDKNMEEKETEDNKKKAKKQKHALLEEASILTARNVLDEQSSEKMKKKKKAKKCDEPIDKVPLQTVTQEIKVKKSKKIIDSSKMDSVQKIQEIPRMSKKRPISEIVEDYDADIVEKPKSKKKLNILKQVPNTSELGYQKKSDKHVKPSFTTLSSKLNNLIPKSLDVGMKQVKKKKKVTVEPKKELKRPVWTSAGTFIEESVMPYSFKTTEYKPINIGSSGTTKFGVVAFTANKKEKFVPNAVDFKMQQIMKRAKSRDKSIKNLKNLI